MNRRDVPLERLYNTLNLSTYIAKTSRYCDRVSLCGALTKRSVDKQSQRLCDRFSTRRYCKRDLRFGQPLTNVAKQT
ncbi:hypothetical protein [Tolypothrix sp. NIES-4075]|uniref:hypothetical protein n=1 Tax=Tolypothrix sp. NIES-4075 TaxID=2005459 RepID=UPI00135A4234|nr:hypothetical protein [Tolypothrix sp. NIES-4075]